MGQIFLSLIRDTLLVNVAFVTVLQMPTDSRIALKLSHFETQLEDIPLVVQIVDIIASKHVIKALNFLLLLENSSAKEFRKRA